MNIQEQIVEKILQNREQVYTYIPNPDIVRRGEIEKQIRENDGYCCCAVEKNDDTKCICKNFRDQIVHGMCHCGRYYKVLKCKKVCLCGSTKFKELFFEASKQFTLAGYIVEMPGVFAHSGDIITDEEKKNLDEVHKSKINDCDLVFIINKDGYIGESTRDEIEWAKKLKKPIEYLEDLK